MVKTVEDLAQLVVKAAEDKKAENLKVLDIRKLSVIADYFMICHGNNERQVQAIVREIRDQAHKNGFDVRGIEGADEGRWVLVDLGDIVIHVFHREDREFYNLERLWKDAEEVSFSVQG
ncbi:ribosome silencing factor [Brevibacillus sp. HB1.2]|uniref:Ribosomal silencing factor RsfS n=1 Tax=Brevibacillus porteri TaxID=2126350 RepID=A0ABX5FNZ5_9BACL|nr:MULTISPECIES: ribosome silencing factor [Brevibacillus]ATF12548.1 ribosome silencing factor [Brevibacillus brevis X23]MDC0764336.1 ribosome silencing factor [Brevibacillus sp. AG]MED1802182.1 ribosome silencing factor [Brevibacillus porteri]MED2129648.1 ribosome silencing factor [Brevibacillus porteri]MED2743443.1 ribosome silencing factor [Brevibacillus porteri]